MLCGSQYLCHINYFEYPVSLPGHALHTPHLVIITIILSYHILVTHHGAPLQLSQSQRGRGLQLSLPAADHKWPLQPTHTSLLDNTYTVDVLSVGKSAIKSMMGYLPEF